MKKNHLLHLLCCLTICFPSFGFEEKNITARGTLNNARIAIESGKPVSVAFMGGSITEMKGYRPIMMEWLEHRFPKAKFNFINAGMSSTCSTTGAFRLRRDVLDHGPIDLFFLEFAVNDDQDANHNRKACIRGMEGIIRQVRMLNPKTEIIVTYFVNKGMLAMLQSGIEPVSMSAHEKVLEKYRVSRIHLARELAHQVSNNQFTWEKFGGTHPKKPGNQLCADMHIEMLNKSWNEQLPSNIEEYALPENPIDSLSYFNGRFLSPSNVQGEGWTFSEPDWGKLDGSKRSRYLGIPMLHSDSTGLPILFNFSGRAIGAFVVAGPDAGVIEYSIDQQKKGTIDLFHRHSNGLHYPRTVMFAHDLKSGNHEITLKIKGGTKKTSVRIMEFCVN
jgi:lysophospholipase L1-like esterase